MDLPVAQDRIGDRSFRVFPPRLVTGWPIRTVSPKFVWICNWRSPKLPNRKGTVGQLKVQMPRTPAPNIRRRSVQVGDNVTAFYLLTTFNVETTKVNIVGNQAITIQITTMIDDKDRSCTGVRSRGYHNAIRNGVNGLTVMTPNVDALVPFSPCGAEHTRRVEVREDLPFVADPIRIRNVWRRPFPSGLASRKGDAGDENTGNTDLV